LQAVPAYIPRMSGEVHGLQEFYAAPPGQVAQRLLAQRIGALWPDCTGLDVLGLGWALPYMGLWSAQRGRRITLVPASFGPPRGGAPGEPRGCALTDDHDLPLPDRSLDRILLVHGLEASERARPLLRECWRVLRDDGRLMVVAPNRLGCWALFDHTPFGQGRPYSRGQLSRLLEAQLFHVLRREAALFVPPFPWRFALQGARLWEVLGRAVARRFAGVTLIEAEKDMFAALPAGAVAIGRRVVQAVPSRYASAAPVVTESARDR
jgi:SAM-dependent methyltransferase